MLATLERPRRLKAVQEPTDIFRRHFDMFQATSEVAHLSSMYDMHLRYAPCSFRKGLFHIEFDVEMTAIEQLALQMMVDGYRTEDVLRETGSEMRLKTLHDKMCTLAKRVGALNRPHLIAIAVHYGIFIPTVISKGA